MDFSSIISVIADKGWRVGLSVSIAAAVVVWGHYSNWPEPGILRPWLGIAIVAGSLGGAITVVAFASAVCSRISQSLRNVSYEAEKQRNNERKFAEIRAHFYARLTALEPFQRRRLLELLRTENEALFLVRDGDGPSQSLIGTMLTQSDITFGGSLCGFHPIIQFERAKVIERLEQMS